MGSRTLPPSERSPTVADLEAAHVGRLIEVCGPWSPVTPVDTILYRPEHSRPERQLA